MMITATRKATHEKNEADFSRSRRLSALIELFLKDYAFSLPVIGALACAFVSALILTGDFSGRDESEAFSVGTGGLKALFTVNAIFILLLVGVIARKLYHLRSAVKLRKQSRFGYRLALLLSVASIAPALLIAIFSAVTVKISMESWFNKRVESAIYNADAVAKAYLAEHSRNIRGDVLAASADIRVALNGDLTNLMSALKFQALTRDLRYIGIFSSQGERLLYFSVPGEDGALTKFDWSRLREQRKLKSAPSYFQPDIALKPDKTGVTALVPLTLQGEERDIRYLYIMRDINPEAVRNNESASGAVRGYELLKLKKRYAEIGFTLIYLSFCLSVTAFMFYAGVYFARGASAPLEALIQAADRLRAGDRDSALPEPVKIRDEIDRLISAFNGMAGELRQREHDLLYAREVSEDRGKFNEAVLFGVSSGVIALGGAGEIRAVNRIAADLLQNDPLRMSVGRSLKEICPVFYEAFLSLKEKLPAREGESREYRVRFAECDLTRTRAGGAGEGKFQVRLTLCGEDRRDIDYVMTFDDVTELVKAQSAAAWRDVARRIAHEIKNPLTPISLAAERMRRKWGAQITEGAADFNECASAIIRQTEHIRAMTDSFAKLAQNPNMNFTPQKLRSVIKEVVFLEQIRNPNYQFTVIDKAQRDDLALLADQRMLSQAFTNLLKNAAESMARRGQKEGASFRGRAEIILSKDEQNVAKITITDNGEGLPENIAPYLLFQPYVTGSETGTGVGLAVAESAFQSHQGSVSVSNRQDGERGAVAEIRLPLSENALDPKAELATTA